MSFVSANEIETNSVENTIDAISSTYSTQNTV